MSDQPVFVDCPVCGYTLRVPDPTTEPTCHACNNSRVLSNGGISSTIPCPVCRPAEYVRMVRAGLTVEPEPTDGVVVTDLSDLPRLRTGDRLTVDENNVMRFIPRSAIPYAGTRFEGYPGPHPET